MKEALEALKGSGLAGGLVGGAASGALVSALTSKRGRKLAGKALAVGGVAALGGLAWKAYQGYQRGQGAGVTEQGPSDPAQLSAQNTTTLNAATMPQAEPIPAAPAPVAAARSSVSPAYGNLPAADFEVADTTGESSKGLLLIRAMIAAAAADGHLDDAERSRILARMHELGLSSAERGAVAYELLSPISVDQLVALVNDEPTAIEVYTASVMAIDESCVRGRDYLDSLAVRLELPPFLKEVIEGAPPEPAA